MWWKQRVHVSPGKPNKAHKLNLRPSLITLTFTLLPSVRTPRIRIRIRIRSPLLFLLRIPNQYLLRP